MRPDLHALLFDMIWLGEGRWTWETMYHMPIFLRNFYLKKIEKIADDRQAAFQKAQSRNKSSKKIEKGPF